MRRAISEYKITGIETTLMFGDFVMQHPAFLEGKFDTHFIQHHFKGTELESSDIDQDEAEALATAAVHWFTHASGSSLQTTSESSNKDENQPSSWYLTRRKF